ncbi:MAG TPA: universal stress protein [Nitrospirota bacterium]|nr:universal stress protein [Nitrospirota bacterium]
MPQRAILVADDIENQNDSDKRRSQAISIVASSVAQQLKAGIDLLYVEDIKTDSPREFDASHIYAWHSLHQKKLEEVGGRFTVPVRTFLKSGSPPEQILKALRARAAPELVVMGTRGRKGMERLLIGSVAEEVIRHARRPVMVVGPVAQENAQDFGARKQIDVLVATDLGKNSRAAELYALSLAKRIGARVFLFHCLGDSYRTIIRDSSTAAGWLPLNLDEILTQIRDDSSRLIEQKVRFFQSRGVPCDYKINEKYDVASSAVYQESEHGYSLAVMGTHGRNMLLEAYLGSTARETILNSSIPVIIVHSGR